jgi:ABC-type Na+ efflux pump permease subunit
MKHLLAFNLNEIPLGTGSNIGNTYNSTGFLLSKILQFSLIVAGIILTGLLIFGGIAVIMNAGNGDTKKAQQGKSAITNALIGFAIVILAYTIIQIIEVITGLNILNYTL